MVDEFARLQGGLAEVWPALTLRSLEATARTNIVVHSLSNDPPAHLGPVLPAYEERFLCLVLGLLRTPGSRVVYVTSQPVLPRVVDYWFGLMPDLDAADARQRLVLVSPVDGTFQPLSAKLLSRPRLLDRIRSHVAEPRLAVVVPFVMSDLEVQLALALGIPIYGSHPALSVLGSKSGARRLFREESIPHAVGEDNVHTRSDLVDAIRSIREQRPSVAEVIVKLDAGFSGFGNALINLGGIDDAGLDAAVLKMELEDPSASPEEFLASLEEGGGVVEERIGGDNYRSPSVQLRASPTGEVEVLSTHDQILGGPNGLTFRGSRFPADPGYAIEITGHALQLGRRLAHEGAIGRFAIDFVTVRNGDGPWRSYAIEINLRCGGTTATYFALQALTDAAYDPNRAQLICDGQAKHYVASDHLAGPHYRDLTPDDLLDFVEAGALGWDRERHTGIAFHMISSLAVAGFVGATAIGNTANEAQATYDNAKQLLDTATVK
jgi:hypothetical protein